MNVFLLNLAFSLIFLSESASIHKTNKTLEILKKDVAQVGSAVENFTFDILGEILEDSTEPATTMENKIKKRSVEDDVKNLCQKRCEEVQKVETQQIKELKSEVKKLQEMVKLLQDQQKIIEILDRENETKTETRNEETKEISNSDELTNMMNDLKEVIQNLNETRELMDLQKQKDEILEEELMKQKEEITKLKTVVATILLRNSSETEEHVSARASEFSGIRKLLKSLPEDEEDDGDDDLTAKLSKLQKELKKKRRQQTLFTELKQLEKSLDTEKGGDSDLLKQIITAIKKTEPQGKSDNSDINNLSELQDAINRLRPKEDDTAQFQAVLTKLINNPTNQKPSQITINPQQMTELTKKLTPSNSPYICIVDDGGVKSNMYRPPVNTRNLPFYPPDYYNNQRGQQFFPGQYTPPNYYPQGIANGGSPEKSGNYKGENVEYNQKYQEDLRQQIEGLQAAVDNLNRPEYTQRPEDRVIIDDLERQIGDLRNVVTNLNYDGTRTKRSLENNEVDDGSKEIVSKFMEKLLENDPPKKPEVAAIQKKIDSIKNQLDGNSDSPKSRAATQSYAPPPLPQLYSSELLNPPAREVKSSFKNDFFTEVISKILDKIISAIPVVIQKLFNFSLEQLGKYDSQDYDVQVLFKNLGIFGYLPVILLRIVKGISAFMNMLRKNSFFKNFLMPALILGTVAGSVLFLIWWLQPDDTYPTYSDSSNSNQYQYSAPNNPTSYNYPVYDRSYYNK